MLIYLLAVPLHAASLYIDPPTSTLGRGDTAILQVRIDTDEAAGECINAVSGVLQFVDPITPVDISLGDSIFPMWVEAPTINVANEQVSFAGGIPNGYCGRVLGDPRLTNTLFEVIVQADAAGGQEEIGRVNFLPNTLVYLNDGFGTPADTAFFAADIRVLATTSAVTATPWTQEIEADDRSPQPFSITLAKDEKAFSGRYYISFATTDKETGVAKYEVIEEPLSQASLFQWGRADAPWVETRSPYVLEDQSLNSMIRVKAVDKAGNEYIANLVPDDELRTLSGEMLLTYLLYGVLVVGLFVGGLLGLRHYQHKKQVAELARYDALRHEPQTPNQNDYE